MMYMPPSALDAIERIEKACQGLSVWKDLTKWPALVGVLTQLHSLCLVRIGALFPFSGWASGLS